MEVSQNGGDHYDIFWPWFSILKRSSMTDWMIWGLPPPVWSHLWWSCHRHPGKSAWWVVPDHRWSGNGLPPREWRSVGTITLYTHTFKIQKSVPVLRQIAKSLATATPPATAQLPCNMSTVLHVKGLEGSPQNIFLLPLHIRKLPLPWLWIKTQRCLGEHYDSAQHHPATWISFEQKRTFMAALIFLCKQVFNESDPKSTLHRTFATLFRHLQADAFADTSCTELGVVDYSRAIQVQSAPCRGWYDASYYMLMGQLWVVIKFRVTLSSFEPFFL